MGNFFKSLFSSSKEMSEDEMHKSEQKKFDVLKYDGVRALKIGKLAYAIKNEINGYYFVMQVEANHEAISEFDRKALLDENVLRHLIIKLDEE